MINFGSGLITKRYGKKRAATLGVEVREGGSFALTKIIVLNF